MLCWDLLRPSLLYQKSKIAIATFSSNIPRPNYTRRYAINIHFHSFIFHSYYFYKVLEKIHLELNWYFNWEAKSNRRTMFFFPTPLLSLVTSQDNTALVTWAWRVAVVYAPLTSPWQLRFAWVSSKWSQARSRSVSCFPQSHRAGVMTIRPCDVV